MWVVKRDARANPSEAELQMVAYGPRGEIDI